LVLKTDLSILRHIDSSHDGNGGIGEVLTRSIPGFAKMSVVNKLATEARSGVNPFTKEPMEFAAKPASKSVKASPLKVAKDAV
jgi:Bacterial DNA-binding protein